MILRKRRCIEPLEDWTNIEMPPDHGMRYEDIVKIFHQLPETYRAVLEMKLLIGYTDKEIAARLGISETAVSSRANRGRTLLKNLMEKEGMIYD